MRLFTTNKKGLFTVWALLVIGALSIESAIPYKQYQWPVKYYDAINLENQSAGIGVTGWVQPFRGMYRLCSYMNLTTAGSAGTIGLRLSWNDSRGNKVLTPFPDLTVTNADAYGQSCVPVWIPVPTAITYQVVFNTVTGSPVWDAHINIERLY